SEDDLAATEMGPPEGKGDEKERNGCEGGDQARWIGKPLPGGRGSVEQLQVGEEFGGVLVAFGAIFGQGAAKNFLGGRLRQRGYGLIEDGDNNVAFGSSVEGPLASEHFVQDDAETPEVGTAVELFAAGLLRRHVFHGADSAALT